MIEKKIKNRLAEVLKEMGIDNPAVGLEHPEDVANGDYSSNVALVYAKQLKMKPKELAEDVLRYIVVKKPEGIEKVEVAGAGFINFYLTRDFFSKSIEEINKNPENFGKNKELEGKKVMVEYTNPNPFKEFHIGHLMDNAIGEAVSRIFEFQGADVKRACWQGDVGMHVAKALWGIIKNQEKFPKDSDTLSQKAKFLGEAYALGATEFEKNEKVKNEIKELNKKIFERTDNEVNGFYDKGRGWSLEYFEGIYKQIGTKFDYYFFEGKEGPKGKTIVEEFLGRGVFEKSEGAVVFKGEKYGLHTRVFINSEGLPTYEAKELGLNKKKFELEKLDLSVIVTGNEINDYFKVLLKVMELVYPEIASKTRHLSHGFLRLPEGKMSSRTGEVITGESLISAVEAMVHKKLEERELETAEKNKIAEIVAIGAIKYSILRQAIGGDIIFDFEKSISFEGDSGPYLEYSYVRAKSVLSKSEFENTEKSATEVPEEVFLLEKLLYRFPEIVKRSGEEYSPHLIVTYLTELAGVFNGFYAANKIVGSEHEAYLISLTKAFTVVMKNGLWILGIKAPDRM